MGEAQPHGAEAQPHGAKAQPHGAEGEDVEIIGEVMGEIIEEAHHNAPTEKTSAGSSEYAP